MTARLSGSTSLTALSTSKGSPKSDDRQKSVAPARPSLQASHERMRGSAVPLIGGSPFFSSSGGTFRPRATLPGAAGPLGRRRPGKPRRDPCSFPCTEREHGGTQAVSRRTGSSREARREGPTRAACLISRQCRSGPAGAASASQTGVFGRAGGAAVARFTVQGSRFRAGR